MAQHTLGNNGGVFSPGTTKRGTLNMYDTHASTFHALPDGPYEALQVHDQTTAQGHFNSTREIKLKNRQGMVLPSSSYADHYPPKPLPPQEELPDTNGTHGTLPFTARTEYDDQYFNKPRMARPAEPLQYTHRPQPWLTTATTNQHFYKPHDIPLQDTVSPERGTRQAALPPAILPNEFNTTYRTHFVPKETPDKMPTGIPEPRSMPPWMAGPTTYQDHYVPKEMALRPVFDMGPGAPHPFLGTTEYKGQYVPKENYPVLPPLTGVTTRVGLQLPFPRRSLGVEFWHNGKSDQYYILIPRHLDVPCSARQVFTTVHDNQDQACILVLYGDDPVASNNTLLGQFDIINIPPAPKDVPRIEVTFKLDKASFLTVEARDLDTERHKRWLQRGQIVVLKA